ncbi:MAG: hypothetical protein ACK55Z_26415, partial [bacterium]
MPNLAHCQTPIVVVFVSSQLETTTTMAENPASQHMFIFLTDSLCVCVNVCLSVSFCLSVNIRMYT